MAQKKKNNNGAKKMQRIVRRECSSARDSSFNCLDALQAYVTR